MHATINNRNKDLIRLRSLYLRMVDMASAPNEVETCHKHINRLLLKHGWKIDILGPNVTIPHNHGYSRQDSYQQWTRPEYQYKKPRAPRRFDARDLTEADRLNIIRFHNQGLTNQEISLKVKASPLYIGKFLNDLGFKLKRGRRAKTT